MKFIINELQNGIIGSTLYFDTPDISIEKYKNAPYKMEYDGDDDQMREGFHYPYCNGTGSGRFSKEGFIEELLELKEYVKWIKNEIKMSEDVEIFFLGNFISLNKEEIKDIIQEEFKIISIQNI